jgi:hypothetical protein
MSRRWGAKCVKRLPVRRVQSGECFNNLHGSAAVASTQRYDDGVALFGVASTKFCVGPEFCSRHFRQERPYAVE